MQRVVKVDLALKSLQVTRCQLLAAQHCQKRLERCQKILNRLKGIDAGKVIVFSDEKNFTVDAHVNRMNDRYIGKDVKSTPSEITFAGRSKFPAKAMMLGIVCSDGMALPPFWVDGSMNVKKYKNLLVYHIIPTLNSMYGEGNWIWTQAGAPCHTAKAIQSYLDNKLGSRGFWSKALWPPNSPNLNPLDFFVWQHVETKASATPHKSVSALKAAVTTAWMKMSEEDVQKACGSFRHRVEACIGAEDGVFEK